MFFTTLVNKDNPIKPTYLNKVTLVKTKNINDEDVLIEENTLQNFLKLKDFFQKRKIIIGISSAFLPLDNQKDDFFEASFSKIEKGFSEHHTGLAVDFAIWVDNHYIVTKEEAQRYSSLYEEIYSYLKEYGFILRYPKEKELSTKHSFEPWHIRYVGKIPASLIVENNLTLEEYLNNFSGIVVINKEKNMTSFDVVHEISTLFGIKKVGHTGTLDPLAQGVMLVAINKATKIVELLTAYEKEYIASVKLGIQTDTLDITGTIINKKEIPKKLPIEDALNFYKKTYLQEVPIYSAVKVNGKKLYEYARNNKKIILPKKEVTIKEIELLKKEKDTFTFRALVSKGCYIRSLIRDISLYLNTYGTMTELIRTKQGNISLDNAYTLEDIKNGNYKLLSITDVLNYPVIIVDNTIAFKIKNGQNLDNIWNIKDKVIFKNSQEQILGIYEVNSDKLKVWKNF